MERSVRRVALLASIAFALCLGGCRLASLGVLIPDFESKQVLGIWVCQFSQASGEFERTTQLVFTELFDREGVETLAYLSDGWRDLEGNPLIVTVTVERNPQNSDEVTLELLFPCFAPGAFKVSTYNAFGDSPLSEETVYL